jgi:hypothetical protein
LRPADGRAVPTGTRCCAREREDGIRQAGGFAEPQRWQFAPAKLAEALAGIGAAIDMMGGSFTMGYATSAVTATRATVG